MIAHPGRFSRLLARAHFLILLPSLGVLMATLLWTVIYFQLVDTRVAVLDAATTKAETLSRDYADRSARLLRQVDQATQFVKFAFEQQQQAFYLDELLRRKGVLPPELSLGVTISDSNGNGIAGVRSGSLDNIADRGYFRRHATQDNGELFISKPLLEPNSTQWSIIVSRRLNRADGSFAGVVAIALKQAALTQLSSGQIGATTFVGLLGTDGTFRANRIGSTDYRGEDGGFSAWVKPGPDSTAVTVLRDNPRDHLSRIFSFQKLDDFPLQAVVGIDEQAALAAYYRQRNQYVWSGLAGTGAILFILAILMLQGARLRKSEQIALAAQAAFKAAAEGSLDALTILQSRYDAHQQIVDFVITEINDRGADLLDKEKFELIGMSLTGIVSPRYGSGFFEKYRQVVSSGQVLEEEFQLVTSAGKHLWLRQQIVPIADGLAVTTRDISARKEAELATRNSRNFLQSLIDNLPLIVYARDLRNGAGKTIVWNQTAEIITGYTSDVVLGVSGPTDLPAAISEIFQGVETLMRDDPLVINLPDVPFQTRSGAIHHLRVVSVPLLDDDGKLEYILGIAEDITVSRRQELALRSKQAELVAANDASPLGLFRTDQNGNCTYVNRTYEEMSGLSGEQALDAGWVQAIHPEDRLKVFQTWGQTSGEHAAYQGAYRFLHATGKVVWVSTKTAPIVVDGVVEGYVGSVDDITARRESEKALSKSEQRLRTITDTLPALVAFVDADLRFRFNNLAYERAFNISRDDMKYKSVREFVGEAQYGFMEPYLQRAMQGETVTFEHEDDSGGIGANNSNGGDEDRWSEATYIPQLADDGKEVVGIHMMIHDITAKKREERRLLQLAQIDSLTSLLNRAGFEKKLDDAMAFSKRNEGLMALLYLDIDHFKNINDTHGHPVGDALLRAFSGRLLRALRVGDTIARLGGDEFTVIMANLANVADAEKIAGKIIDSMRALFKLDGVSLSITASIGIAFYNGTAMDAKDLIRQSDEMLYQAKESGRNQYCLRQPDQTAAPSPR